MATRTAVEIVPGTEAEEDPFAVDVSGEGHGYAVGVGGRPPRRKTASGLQRSYIRRMMVRYGAMGASDAAVGEYDALLASAFDAVVSNSLVAKNPRSGTLTEEDVLRGDELAAVRNSPIYASTDVTYAGDH